MKPSKLSSTEFLVSPTTLGEFQEIEQATGLSKDVIATLAVSLLDLSIKALKQGRKIVLVDDEGACLV